MPRSRPYHHGDLRNAVLDAATAEIAAEGSSTMSLRKVAARAGVTHPAAAHHFGDKRGVLTALAARGYRGLADALADAAGAAGAAGGSGLLELGVAYLRFAHEHRALFEVMYRPDLLDLDHPDLVEARAASDRLLTAAAGSRSRRAGDVAVGAWSMVHGFATLWLAGNIRVETFAEAEALFRRAAVAFTSIGGRDPGPA